MAVEDALTRPVTVAEPTSPPTPPRPTYFRRGILRVVLGGAAVGALVATGGVEYLYKNEASRLSDSIENRAAVQPEISQVLKSLFNPHIINPDFLPPISESDREVNPQDLWFNFLRGLKRQTQVGQMSEGGIYPDDFPAPKSATTNLENLGAHEVETTANQANFLILPKWSLVLNTALSLTFSGDFGGDDEKINQALSVRAIIQGFDQFSQTNISTVFRTANQLPRPPVTQTANGQQIDGLNIGSKELVDILKTIANIPVSNPEKQDWDEAALIARPGLPNYLSHGVRVKFQAGDGKPATASLNSLGDLILEQKLI